MATTETKKSELSTAETSETEKSGTYIGDFLAQDVCAFCNVKRKEDYPYYDKSLGIVHKIWTSHNRYRAFNWVGGLLPVDWLVYRGMIPQAIIVHIFCLLYYFIMNAALPPMLAALFPKFAAYHTLLYYIIFLGIMVTAMGFISTIVYKHHVFRQLKKRNLSHRKNFECPELDESLRKQGKPSIKRAIVYRLITYLSFACIEGLIITLVYGSR